jgi:putative DNA primase/helicase
MLEGRVTEQMLVIMHGTGANGKSTFNETIDWVLGHYATAADATLLSDPEAHPTAIANLAGRRVILANELGTVDEARVKMLTSQDTLQARRMREDFWTFTPTHNIVAATNDKPRFHGTSEGIWRRIQLVPWDVQIPRREWDRDLALKLREEADFIMSWLIAGYRKYRTYGLGVPSGVQAANVSLRDELDPVSAWLRERCVREELVSSTAKELWENFETWKKKVELPRNVTQTAFGISLGNKGFEKKRTSTGNTWIGVRIK